MLEVDALLETWTKHVPKQEIADRLLAAGVPCAPVRDLSEVMNDRNMHERGSLQWVDHPTMGRIAVPHSPLRFENGTRVALKPSAELGTDNRAVYGDWLGVSERELDQLAEAGVF